MLNALANSLSGIFSGLSGRGLLTESDVDSALRQLRLTLLEADVALPVVKDLLTRVRVQAVGEKVLKSIQPAQQIVKILHDEVLATLGEAGTLTLNVPAPAVILLCGLQGGGKTTTAGKLALMFTKQGKSVMLASLDTYRPAAQQQLEILAGRVGCASLAIVAGEQPPAIAKRALAEAKKTLTDILILDTAGRTDVDAEMMAELKNIHALATPAATLLVADSQTGQVAVNIAQSFMQQVPLTGLILTRADGDGRGGAILSMRAITGVPILFLGMGEKLEALDIFRPASIASRIVGQGDVISLVEKLQAASDTDMAAGMEQAMKSGRMSLTDLRKQLAMMQRMAKGSGGLGGLLGMLPGMGALQGKLPEGSDKKLLHQMAMIDSMTKQERANPDLLNARRKIRIAKGAGVRVEDVNKLLKAHTQMNDMMKKMSKLGPAGLMAMMKGK